MLERMKAFIDSFETITILVDKNIRTKGKSFYLLEDGKKKEIRYFTKLWGIWIL